jgi:hypothetical protein
MRTSLSHGKLIDFPEGTVTVFRLHAIQMSRRSCLPITAELKDSVLIKNEL